LTLVSALGLAGRSVQIRSVSGICLGVLSIFVVVIGVSLMRLFPADINSSEKLNSDLAEI
jgi:hypothetical protein